MGTSRSWYWLASSGSSRGSPVNGDVGPASVVVVVGGTVVVVVGGAVVVVVSGGTVVDVESPAMVSADDEEQAAVIRTMPSTGNRDRRNTERQCNHEFPQHVIVW